MNEQLLSDAGKNHNSIYSAYRLALQAWGEIPEDSLTPLPEGEIDSNNQTVVRPTVI